MSHLQLRKMFSPASIAVFGVTEEEEGSLGHALLQNLLVSFKGQVFPIAPAKARILDRPCFASLAEVSQTAGHVVDLAAVISPAAQVPSIIEACGLAGVRAVVLFSELLTATRMPNKYSARDINAHSDYLALRQQQTACGSMSYSQKTDRNFQAIRSLQCPQPCC